MRHPVLRAVVVMMVLGVCATAASRGASATVPVAMGVQQLDVGYRLGDGGLKIRATLASGEAVEYSTNDAREVTALLQVAQACGSGATALSAVVEERTLKAIQCSINRSFGIAR